MNLLKDILQAFSHDFAVTDIQVGIHWTAVVSKQCGLASTLCEPPPHHGKQVRDVGRLHQKNGIELAQYILSDRLLEASIGLAAINSLIDIDENRCEPVNAYHIIVERGKDKTIGVIGHFPFTPQLRQQAHQLFVFEKRLQPGDLPESEMIKLLPQCDVVAISATTLINHTLENILDLSRKEAFKIMLGASTPMLPILFDYGLNVLSGCKVTDSGRVLTSIRQSATFKQIDGIKLLSMKSYQ